MTPVIDVVDAERVYHVTEELEVGLKRKRLRAIARALRNGKKPKLTVKASVTDAAGNVATDAVTVTAKR